MLNKKKDNSNIRRHSYSQIKTQGGGNHPQYNPSDSLYIRYSFPLSPRKSVRSSCKNPANKPRKSTSRKPSDSIL